MNIKILKTIKELKRRNGFSFEGFQQKVVNIESQRDRIKTADEICKIVSDKCSVGCNEVLKLLPLCFTGINQHKISIDTVLYLDNIDINKIDMAIQTINTI